MSHTFTEITNEGLFSGILKGSLLAAAQFSLILYPSVYITNKSSNKYVAFLASYTVLDALLYPVDTIKNILYSETHRGLSKIQFILELRTVLGSTNINSLYKGILPKLGFNIPFLTSLYLTTQSDNGTAALLSWLVTGALYPLSTLKVRAQLLPTEFSIGRDGGANMKSGLYRGVVPFLILNALLGWSLRPLFSQ